MASAGQRGFARGNPVAASVGGESVRHERFDVLCAVLRDLYNANKIDAFSVCGPQDLAVLATRKGEKNTLEMPCWDLRAIQVRDRRCKPSAWLNLQSPLSGHSSVYIARSALVLLIEGPLGTGLWIELETNQNKKNREAISSLILARPTGDYQNLVRSALVGLIKRKGLRPAEVVAEHIGDSMACRPLDFRHSYDPPGSGKITEKFVLRALVDACICE